jgi:kumamolisin
MNNTNLESALKSLTAISIAIIAMTSSLVQAAVPVQFPLNKDARVVDRGLAPQDEVRTVTLSLAVKDLAAMEAYAASTVDPASPNYQQFLTPAQVGARFGQDATAVAQVVNFLRAQGLTVTKVYQNKLLITARGTNAQLAAVFGSPIHTFAALGRTYEAPLGKAGVPAQLAGVVRGVHGLNTRPLARSNARRQPKAGVALGESRVVPERIPTPNAAATGTPGDYTTLDLANQYNITPLYKAGITGAGRTVGIATLAGYRQSDAYAYWDALGLKVGRQRITDVLVDGGPDADAGPDSEASGETIMDVEQAGGVAPGADVRVYLAPNTDAGFLDMFAQAADENIVDALSVSWGSPELANEPAALDALHAVFLQAAIQGIPVIASSGDAGAYDLNDSRVFPYPDCTTALSVDSPASDPLVLAAGGTTLPHTRQRTHGSTTVSQERAWAWDYLRDYAVKYYGQAFYYANLFPVGGGGGVSSGWSRPSYQAGLAGVANTAPAQALICKAALLGLPGTGYQLAGTLPANYAGRNLPDVSLNADPYTGYLVYQGGWQSGNGGTSVVSPQLSGILTLISGGRNKRIGLAQASLYAAFKAKGYGPGSPFRAITAGTNLFYASKANYNPATGLGSLDVANLARTLGVQF